MKASNYGGRFTAFILVLLLLATQTAGMASVFGAEKSSLSPVYVSSEAADSGKGNGTEQSPYKDIQDAYNAVSDGGTIVIKGSYVSQEEERTPSKNITIKGDSADAAWVVRYGLSLGGNLTLDSLKLETTSTDPSGRCIYVNGYSFTMTDTAQCYVNKNDKQKAYIYAGSETGKEITDRKAAINLGGGHFKAVYGYGSNKAPVEQGVDITLRDKATADAVEGLSESRDHTTLTISATQYFTSNLKHIGKLKLMAGKTTVHMLENVKDVELGPGSELNITGQQKLRIEGNLIFRGTISCGADISVVGAITGAGTISNGFVGTITGSQVSDATIAFSNTTWDWELVKTEPGRWVSRPKDTSATLYVNGKADASGDGQSAETPFKTMAEVTAAAENLNKEQVHVAVFGDTTWDQEAVLSGKTFTFYGQNDAKLIFRKPLKVTSDTIFQNIHLDFDTPEKETDIVIAGAVLSFSQAVATGNVPPDITTADGPKDNQLSIESGSFGNITDPAKAGTFDFLGGEISGTISGWSMLNAGGLEDDQIGLNAEVSGPIRDIEFFSLEAKCDNFILKNSAKVGDLEANGQTLRILSGKTLEAGSLWGSLNLIVIPANEAPELQEGSYLSFGEVEDQAEVKLKDTYGYELEKTIGDKVTTYGLKLVPQLETPAPKEIKVESVSLNTSSKTLNAGSSFQLIAAVSPSNASNRTLTWTSSNPSVAAVTGGRVTAKNGGTAVITASSSDGSQRTAACRIVVPYRIVYVLNGGNNSSANPATYYGTTVSLRDPTRAGYTFGGWYGDGGYTNRVASFSGGDYTLYAKWIKVNVSKTKIKSLKKTSKTKMKVSYKKISGAAGYQIAYSTSKKFRKKQTKYTTTKATSKKLTKLKKGKRYYVKVRAYKKDSAGKKIYGKYSAVKSKK
ncbi:InlB B-repeat-containing protein [Anaerovorax odorimutans]|uniref:InlB B-repeat-containing protein n=1 Tax=Anaerovorax odorimutans TaxID=109327 RepID=A0ABT1RPG3_9FIRM|nr:Ig-like domain-containing protein [Anaerovorax odorimutans]MCQ4637077.1 InlB B-repeat-containing protein [Anaerovorax odorimutans]